MAMGRYTVTSIGAGLQFGARVQGFPPGLVGTVGVQILDNIGGVVAPGRSTLDIIEDPVGTGSYLKNLTAPIIDGQYTIMWDWGADPDQHAFEDLFVVASGASVRITSAFVGAMPDEPHFDLPFRLTGKSFATVQQDSPEDVANCVECIVRTPLGFREDTENFGLDDLTFENQPLNLEEIKTRIQAQEPRATLMLEQDVLNLVNKLTIKVGS